MTSGANGVLKSDVRGIGSHRIRAIGVNQPYCVRVHKISYKGSPIVPQRWVLTLRLFFVERVEGGEKRTWRPGRST